ncbi:hypothetical protein QYF36_017764 [Acer negundo]|nr:hypothetical protein QYF36_017764 [Acer negundo]
MLGRFYKSTVKVNIIKPFRRCLRVDIMADGKETVMLLRYEQLPNLCFRYGRLGHSTRECPDGDCIRTEPAPYLLESSAGGGEDNAPKSRFDR